MALPACFHLADDVFPRVRAEAARRLLADGLTQSATAARLGVSQAMVSKYTNRDPEQDAVVLRLVDELLQPDAAPDAWCQLLAQEPGHDGALADLLRAERLLMRNGTVRLAPEVGINIAVALPGATSPDDILAYPARIVAAGDRLIRPVPPARGGSRHLSACLLAMQRHAPNVGAIVNIRSDALEPDATMGDGDRNAAFAAAVAANPQARIIRDPGAVGIEPCLYVAADTATNAISTILKETT